MSDFEVIREADIDWQENIPVARHFNDPYFSRDDGKGETQHVFIEGNQLPRRFRELPDNSVFTIAETGFGTGQNLIAAVRCFLSEAPPSAQLELISTEKHPLSADDFQRAHKHSADVISDALVRLYPPPVAGFHRRQLLPRINLTLLYGDSREMLALLDARVDAWFLDGFAPSRNSAMWQPTLFREIARLSHTDTTLATFTAAGFVRRGLQAEGFAMSRVPGYGRKREMLIGHYRANTNHHTLPAAPAKVIVIGAGLAGATCARALAELNIPVTVYDPQGIANAASGNLAGVVYTTPSGHPTAQNRFYQQSYLHALHWLARYHFPSHPDQGALSGVIQLPKDQRHREKAQTALNSGLWPDSVVKAAQGWPENTLNFVGGGYIAPQRWCEHLLDHPLISFQRTRITGLARCAPSTIPSQEPHSQDTHSQDTHWAALNDQGREIDQAPHIVLANSFDAMQLHSIKAVTLKRIRGQVSHVRAQPASSDWRQAFCHSGYLTPAIQGLHCVGASFDLHRSDAAADDNDDRANLAELQRNLPEHWQALGGNAIELVSRRVGFRCQSTDFLPLAGMISEGLWCSIAHGSRGITGTPLCADLIANAIVGLPTAVDREILDALSPSRFMLRQR